jgi:hypothetical protein
VLIEPPALIEPPVLVVAPELPPVELEPPALFSSLAPAVVLLPAPPRTDPKPPLPDKSRHTEAMQVRLSSQVLLA